MEIRNKKKQLRKAKARLFGANGEKFKALAQYLIGNMGTIVNMATGREILGYIHQSRDGIYQRVTLNLHGRRVRIFAHRLIAIMHCNAPKGIGIETPGDFDMQVNHIDGNTLNNEASNLEWVTAKDNKAHEHYLTCATKAGLL